MLLWIILALMTAAAILAIMLPLARARREAVPDIAGDGDIAVYKDQLVALDEEVARGLLGEAEAQAARTEISRRLIAASERTEGSPPSGPRRSPATLASLMAVFVVTVALGGYLASGSPDLPGQPLAQRQAGPLEQQDVEVLLSRVESHLQDNPEDGKGWDVVAPVYFKLRRFEDAGRAYANAIRLLGESAIRLGGLGEAEVQANDGMVTSAARTALARASELDHSLVRPRFYLALGLEQDGKLAEAARAWRALLDDTPDAAPWRGIVAQRLAAVQAQIGETSAASTTDAPGPSAQDVEQAANLSPAQRAQMVEQMVARLAGRLKEDGKDLDGWLRLMRAYSVLGRTREAQGALADAKQNFAGDDTALARIEAAAKDLGLSGSGARARDPS